MLVRVLGFGFLFLWQSACLSAQVTIPAATGSDLLYDQAQKEFHRKNYAAALPLLEQFIKSVNGGELASDKLIGVIDQVGFIQLRINHDPDAALAFFTVVVKDSRLDVAQRNVIGEWIGVAQDWSKYRQLPVNITDAGKLYELGKQFYEEGIKKLKYPLDKAGHADFHIASTYLLPFITNYDSDPHIGDALYMMGDIRRRIITDSLYWSENFYLKEVIRRFPHTPLARKAWESLNDEVHFAYSGSGGDSTPPDLLRMLEQFKQLAEPPSPVLTPGSQKRKSPIQEPLKPHNMIQHGKQFT